MRYAIDDNLLSKLKQLASSAPGNTDLLNALSAAEADPLISSLMWTKADMLAASRTLIQGDTPKNPDGSRFDCNLPFADSARERLAHEIAGDPDEFALGIRDEVDSAIELGVIDRLRDEVETELGEIGADHQGYDDIPADYAILKHLSAMPEEVLAGGFNACAREIAVRALRGLL